jgi:phage gp36-like protein
VVPVVYATADEVRSAVARDPNKPTGTAASLEDEQLDEHIVNAQAEVDGTLRGRYTTPMVPCPEMVKQITIDIASYVATLSYREGKDLTVQDPVSLRYTRAQRLLARIADGTIDLDAGDGGAAQPSTVGGLGAPINANPRLFALSDFDLGVQRGRGRGRGWDWGW